MVIYLFPNQRTGFSPFFSGLWARTRDAIQLLRGNETAKTESVASFIQRITSDWELARENLQRPVGLQQKYYDRKHKDVHY